MNGRLPRILLPILVFASTAFAADPPPAAQVVIRSPDVAFSGAYDLPCRSAVVDSLLEHPGLLGRLWTLYGFAPAYRVAELARTVHIEDPTGIAGDLSLVQTDGNRRVYLGDGRLNHRLLPGFGGRMALVLTTEPSGAGTRCRLEVFVRTESRTLGFMAWSLFPLIRGHIENRVRLNLQDVGTILRDVSTAPAHVASRLGGADAELLNRLIPSSGR